MLHWEIAYSVSLQHTAHSGWLKAWARESVVLQLLFNYLFPDKPEHSKQKNMTKTWPQFVNSESKIELTADFPPLTRSTIYTLEVNVHSDPVALALLHLLSSKCQCMSICVPTAQCFICTACTTIRALWKWRDCTGSGGHLTPPAQCWPLGRRQWPYIIPEAICQPDCLIWGSHSEICREHWPLRDKTVTQTPTNTLRICQKLNTI